MEQHLTAATWGGAGGDAAASARAWAALRAPRHPMPPPPAPRRVGLISGDLTPDGAVRLGTSAEASVAAGAGALIVTLDPPVLPDRDASASLRRLHLLAAAHGATVTLVTSDPQLRLALAGLPIPGGARLAASAPVALRAAAGELAPLARRAIQAR